MPLWTSLVWRGGRGRVGVAGEGVVRGILSFYRRCFGNWYWWKYIGLGFWNFRSHKIKDTRNRCLLRWLVQPPFYCTYAWSISYAGKKVFGRGQKELKKKEIFYCTEVFGARLIVLNLNLIKIWICYECWVTFFQLWDCTSCNLTTFGCSRSLKVAISLLICNSQFTCTLDRLYMKEKWK